MTRRQQLTAALDRCTRLSASISQRWAAHIALHEAACINGDVAEMRQRREDLHVVLDTLLDNGEAVHRLTYELTSLTDR